MSTDFYNLDICNITLSIYLYLRFKNLYLISVTNNKFTIQLNESRHVLQIYHALQILAHSQSCIFRILIRSLSAWSPYGSYGADTRVIKRYLRDGKLWSLTSHVVYIRRRSWPKGFGRTYAITAKLLNPMVIWRITPRSNGQTPKAFVWVCLTVRSWEKGLARYVSRSRYEEHKYPPFPFGEP